jgi:uncharacterized protein
LASPWRYTPRKIGIEKGVQIDLLFDRYDAISICEIKYTDKPFVIDKNYVDVLKQKIEIFKRISRTNKQIFLILISANGIKQTQYSKELVTRVITLENLFKKN